MRDIRSGFTLVEIMIVVSIIALLAVIAVPSFLKARQNARQSACINNMRLIDHAKEQWATSCNHNNGDAVVVTEVNSYLRSTPVSGLSRGWRIHLSGDRHAAHMLVVSSAGFAHFAQQLIACMCRNQDFVSQFCGMTNTLGYIQPVGVFRVAGNHCSRAFISHFRAN